jgi:DNA (cytosine-5)-methyltransferase 1
LNAAGFDVRWGIEYDDDIASVARANGLNVRTADVTTADLQDYPQVDLLHASPPCPNFSVAKTGARETDEDVSLARATTRFIAHCEPELFTLENVWGYRKSQSWQHIQRYLQQNGYKWGAWKLNAADYGVPQRRKRMIVAARKGGPRPVRPTPTHGKEPPAAGLFGDTLNKWVGWYESVADLVPDLPETELADWQKTRLPDELKETLVIDTQPNARGDCSVSTLPTKTVAADPAGGLMRAILIDGQNTLPAASGKREDRKLMMYEGHQPANPVNASQYKGTGRAVLVDTGNTSRKSTALQAGAPSMTISAWHGRRPSHAPVAHVSHRVVQMTPRCLARFQSFPDSYDLPENKTLACKIIGNAVPPLMMQRIVQHLTRA